MKYLQNLVPGCNKITGKAGMLDEIINYVQSLQRQVEVIIYILICLRSSIFLMSNWDFSCDHHNEQFLSMKLAAVNPRLDCNIDNIFAKEVRQHVTDSKLSRF